MAERSYPPTQVRELTVNGEVLDQDIMADNLTITWNDRTDGQDSLEIAISNKDRRYFREKIFIRGLPVKFKGGITGDQVMDVFSGYISAISASGGSSGEKIIITCYPVNTMKREYYEPSVEVIQNQTSFECMKLLLRHFGIQLVMMPWNKMYFPATSVVVAYWYPRYFETILQRVRRIANETLGCRAVIKKIKEQVYMVIGIEPSSEQVSNGPIRQTWSKIGGFDPYAGKSNPIEQFNWGDPRIVSYTFRERNTMRNAARNLRGSWNDPMYLMHADTDSPFLKFYWEKFDETKIKHDIVEFIESKIPDSDNDFIKTLKGSMENYLDYLDSQETSTKELAELRTQSIARKASGPEITGSIVIVNRIGVFAGSWITLRNFGPFDGSYFVTNTTTIWGSYGFKQTINFSNKRPAPRGTGESSGPNSYARADLDSPFVATYFPGWESRK
jgi:hypothetical protein